jgi:hypothetical protein
MSDKREVEQVGCFPWLVFIGLLAISAAIGRLADAFSKIAEALQ